MKKIGLILANPITNFGAHLQAFATQHVVDSLGVKTIILDFSGIKIRGGFKKDFGFIVYCIKKLKTRLCSEKKSEIYDEEFYANQQGRTQQAKLFRQRFLHDEIQYSDFIQLTQDVSNLDGVMIGSDQMWLPGSSFSPLNSLRFVPKGVKRLSYATSLGVEEYPRYCWNSAREMWKKMDSVSVREQQGANIIKDVCGEDFKVEVVLDPTYLISKEEWEALIPKRSMMNEKYVFCYFLGDNDESKLCARRYAKYRGYKLVSVLSCESMGTVDRTFADKTLGVISPDDFINWIRGAECVFTDSFHGLAFSVINQRQFYVFYRKRKDTSLSRNSRIDNILNTWQISGHLITDKNKEWEKNNDTPIDYNRVNSILKVKRDQSIHYLKTALK